jgi:hypothetical protein
MSEGENALLLAAAQIPEQNEAESKRWRDALAALKAGRTCEDAELIRTAEDIHAKTEKFSRMRSLFPISVDSPEAKRMLSVMRLFRAEELLARQTALQGDRAKMDRHIDALLAWNRSLRQAHPNLIDWAICGIPWATAFEVLLSDWQNHPDQERQLREIAERFEKARIERSELAGVIRHDLATVLEIGPPPELLRQWKKSGQTLPLLKPPFNDVPVEELLKLPYDQEATAEIYIARWRRQILDLNSGKPIGEWPEAQRTEPQRTLDDYRKMPNGLYHLLEEQLDYSSTLAVLGGGLIMDAQMATCLRWLEAEKTGGEFGPNSSGIVQDPMNGRLLRIDMKSRLIRSVGANSQVDQDEVVPAWVGFHRVLKDPALRVPVWR